MIPVGRDHAMVSSRAGAEVVSWKGLASPEDSPEFDRSAKDLKLLVDQPHTPSRSQCRIEALLPSAPCEMRRLMGTLALDTTSLSGAIRPQAVLLTVFQVCSR